MLHLLAWQGNEKAVDAACRLGADPDTADSNSYPEAGNTPMHIAAVSNHSLVVQSLLNHHASCRIRNHSGLLPMDLVGKDSIPALGEVLSQEEDPSGSIEGLVQVTMKGKRGYAKVIPI